MTKKSQNSQSPVPDKSSILTLIKDYIGGYEKQEHPFLLFDLAHVNENDHTRVLLRILNLQEGFLKSFLQTIGITQEFVSFIEEPTDQKVAIGKDGKGFIDLYFEYKDSDDKPQKVILENKIYDAGDTPQQLARYIATAMGLNPSDPECKKRYNEIWNNWEKGKPDPKYDDFTGIHVIYLTSDDSKKPENISLPKYFTDTTQEGFIVNHINYYPINYLQSIIPWLENDVLPNMPYADEGIAIAGIRQYLASLKAMFSLKGKSDAVNQFVESIEGSDSDRFNQLMDVIKQIKTLYREPTDQNLESAIEEFGIDKEDSRLQSLIRELRSAAMGIFSDDGNSLDGDWKLYFTPSYFFLFRQRWADLDNKKYSIPSLYIVASTISLLGKENIKWYLQVDHLDYRKDYSRYSRFKTTNHNKTASLGPHESEKPSDIDDSNARGEYYKEILGNDLKDSVQTVDRAVERYLNKEYSTEFGSFQETLLALLQEEFANKVF